MKILLPLFFLALLANLNAVPPAVYEPVKGEPFWLEADVASQFPDEPIIRPSDYAMQGSTYFVSPGEKTAAPTAWIEMQGEWLEPKKAPENSKSDNIVLISQSGDLDILSPENKSIGIPAGSPALVIPAGSTLKVKNSWAAIRLGGINTLHLMPNTTVTVNFNSGIGKLDTVIDLKAGGVFSKVGKQDGLIQDYRVKTPQGVAAARGTDYVTLALPTRMEVWIAEGVVDVLDNQGAKVGQVAASNDNALKVLRTPAIADASENAKANAAIMSAAFGFVGQANTRTLELQTKKKQGQALTPEEEAFIKETIPVKFLVKVHKTN